MVLQSPDVFSFSCGEKRHFTRYATLPHTFYAVATIKPTDNRRPFVIRKFRILCFISVVNFGTSIVGYWTEFAVGRLGVLTEELLLFENPRLFVSILQSLSNSLGQLKKNYRACFFKVISTNLHPNGIDNIDVVIALPPKKKNKRTSSNSVRNENFLLVNAFPTTRLRRKKPLNDSRNQRASL